MSPRSFRCISRLGLLLLSLTSISDDALVSATPLATAKVVSACSATLMDANAPVIAPLQEIIGTTAVTELLSLLNSPIGEIVISSEGSSCLANMDGEELGNTLLEDMTAPECAAILEVTEIPFVQYLLGNLTGIAFNGTSSGSDDDNVVISSSTSGSGLDLPTFLDIVSSIDSDQMDEFCDVYVADIVPCLTTIVLPSLTPIRAKHSSGCCDDWEAAVVADYGYTVTGQLTKIAQLVGDVLCAHQTPSFLGNGTQRCGYTFVANALASDDIVTMATTLLADAQVPKDQMCLFAEGQSYVDINNNSIATSSSPSISGCVLTLDRLATWIAGFPVAQTTSPFDWAKLFDEDTCLAGTELYPIIAKLTSEEIAADVGAFINASCVHLPTTYADACTFSRPVSLLDWESQPLPVAEDPSAASDEGTTTSVEISTTSAPIGENASAVTPVLTFVSGVLMALVVAMCL